MTPDGLAQTPTFQGRFQERLDLDRLGQQAFQLNRRLRPYDGWLAAGLLTLNLMVVVWSVQSAEWVPTSNLAFVLLLATICGFLVARLPVWGVLALPLGFVVGLVVVVWRLVSFQHETVSLAGSEELWERLGIWIQAAQEGSISIDPIPFAFALLVLTWLLGLLGAWIFVRYRHFWGVFILGGAGLFANLTYLPPNTNVLLWIYLFTAMVLVARVQSVRRRRSWRERNLGFDGHLGVLSLADSSLIAALVLVLAFFIIPKGSQWAPTNNIYEGLRTPFASVEEDFNRLFAGLPARRALGYRLWGDSMPFQGTINPNTVPVLQVESRLPMYWKARTYDTYTPKGWISQGTRFENLGWSPSFTRSDPYLETLDVEYTIYPNYTTRTLFGSGQVLQSTQDVKIETYDSPVYVFDLTHSAGFDGLPPLLGQIGKDLSQPGAHSVGEATDPDIAAALPPGFGLLEATREGGRLEKITVVEEISQQPDVLSVRSSQGRVGAGEGYRLTSRVSLASPETLRTAGTDYPTWSLVRYTQLPDDLPRRVRDLAEALAGPEDNPYDKAKAIETHLRGMTYDLEIDPPPYGADGVEHFLFDQRRGYSEYFGSAMVVMLRSVGVPARMVTGYSVGDKVADEDVYVVKDNHSHGWAEVFFPRYGWIPFEPTPGRDLPETFIPTPLETRVIVLDGSIDELETICEEDFEECEPGESPAGGAAFGDDGGLTQRLGRSLPWLVGLLCLVLAGIAGGRYFWRKAMEPSQDVEVLFRRLGILGRLNSVGPKPHETPYQYGRRLGEVLPEQEGSLSMLIGLYVRWRYGRKDLSREEIDALTEAWLAIRMPLLLRVFRPRNLQTSRV